MPSSIGLARSAAIAAASWSALLRVTMTLTRQSCSQAASRAPSTLTTGCGLVEISSTR